MQAIKDWLNSGRDYYVGEALYRSYGTEQALKDMFAQGYSDYRRQRLVKAIQELYDSSNKHNTPPPPSQEGSKEASVIVGVVMEENKVPAAKDPYRDQWMPAYQQMNYLRHQLLSDMMTDERRGAMAHQILDLEQTCMHWWHKRDIYLRTGTMPADAPALVATVTDPNMLRAQLNNVRPAISKARKRLAKKPGDPVILAKLEALMQQRDEIEGKLKG